jgi:hypothetical protein
MFDCQTAANRFTTNTSSKFAYIATVSALQAQVDVGGRNWPRLQRFYISGLIRWSRSEPLGRPAASCTKNLLETHVQHSSVMTPWELDPLTLSNRTMGVPPSFYHCCTTPCASWDSQAGTSHSKHWHHWMMGASDEGLSFTHSSESLSDWVSSPGPGDIWVITPTSLATTW